MKRERLDIYKKQLQEIENEFEIYQNSPNLEKIKSIIQKCNIFEKYNIAYLEELKKASSKSDFEEELEIFKDTISSEEMKNRFQIEKMKGKDRITMLINNLILIYQHLCQDDNIGLQMEVKKLLDHANKAMTNYKINFQLLPSDNLELYINTLYRLFYSKIYEILNELELHDNYTEEEKEEIIKMDNDLNNKKLNKIEITNEDKNNLKAYKIIRNIQFSDYFDPLGYFLERVQNDCSKRFKNVSFEKEDDLIIYEKFIFFLEGYRFEYFNYDIVELWKDSLNDTQLSEDEIEKKLEILNSRNENRDLNINFNYHNGNIKVQNSKKKYLISDVKKYSFSLLYKYLENVSSFKNLDEFFLVKIQYFDDFIRQKIITEKWINFYNDVLKSNVINDLLI